MDVPVIGPAHPTGEGVTASLRARAGISLGLGLGGLALFTCVVPWIPMTRSVLRITGVWSGPSSYYLGACAAAAAGTIAVVGLMKRGELKAWRAVAFLLNGLAGLLAIAALALSAMISIGLSS